MDASDTLTADLSEHVLAYDRPSLNPADLLRLQSVSAMPLPPRGGVPNGAVIGRLAGFAEDGAPLVDFPTNSSGQPVPARTVPPLTTNDRGRGVVLLFEQGDAVRPIILGLLQAPAGLPSPGTVKPLEIKLDGERLVFNAEQEIVLRCGKASIALTRAGKVLIRGAYVLSRSSGVNRIKGGSVQIN